MFHNKEDTVFKLLFHLKSITQRVKRVRTLENSSTILKGIYLLGGSVSPSHFLFKIRQLYRNHHIMFLGWNVGCILALKAALVCSVSSIICMSLPFHALSEESKVNRY